MKQEEVLSKNFFLGVFWHEFESRDGVLSRPALRHLESKLSCLILFMAVMAWYHLCHLLLARIPEFLLMINKSFINSLKARYRVAFKVIFSWFQLLPLIHEVWREWRTSTYTCNMLHFSNLSWTTQTNILVKQYQTVCTAFRNTGDRQRKLRWQNLK